MKERIGYLDAAKAVAISLVILGHCPMDELGALSARKDWFCIRTMDGRALDRQYRHSCRKDLSPAVFNLPWRTCGCLFDDWR